MLDIFNLTGKVALVTGGSKGLGKAMARGLAEAGADIVIASRHEEELRPALAEILENTGRRGHFVVIAVAGLAGSVAERAVHTVGHMGSFLTVASRAFYLRYFGGVRIVLDACVAFSAAQNAVDTGRVLGGINRDAFPAVRLHSPLAVAGQATFVLPQRLR